MTLWVPLVLFIAGAALSGVFLTRSLLVVVRVSGVSMEPTFRPDDRVLVRRRAGHRIRVGTVVVLRQPDARSGSSNDLAPAAVRISHQRWLIKRVAALPGDPVPESVRPTVDGAAVVPAEMLVVLGDNSPSVDSRTWGFVPTDHVLGLVVRRLSPVKETDSPRRTRSAGARR
jgi:signal peptidase I